jgi:hypothetical protein
MAQVRYAGEVWDVSGTTQFDGETFHLLQRNGRVGIYARAAECRPVKPRSRRIKAEGYVLEYHADGTLAIRRARSPKRYPIALASIYEFAVRLSVFKSGRVPKHLRARRRRGG